MADKELIYYLKNEARSEELYLIAATCIERLVAIQKPAAIKAVVDAGSSALFNMIEKEKSSK